MENRQMKIKKMLAEKKADVFWLPNREKSGQPGTRYLSGFTGSDSHLLITRKKSYLMTDGRYLVAAKKEVAGCEIADVSERPFIELLKKIQPKNGRKTVLIDGSVTAFSLVEKIQEKIPGLSVKNEDGLLHEIRRVKTPAEITLLKKASAISCKAFEKFLPHIKIGLTEKRLAHILKNLLIESGAENVAFDPIIASGKNSALPHAMPTDKKLARGEFVVIDFGASYKGYVSDMTRTVAIGKISPRLRKMYEAVKEAQEAGCKEARAGVPARAIDSACRRVLAKYGFEKYFTHATGHGIGMEVHELPSTSERSENTLEIGEVLTCEPGIYIPGIGGVRIEDSLAITKNDNINLSAMITKKLLIL